MKKLQALSRIPIVNIKIMERKKEREREWHWKNEEAWLHN